MADNDRMKKIYRGMQAGSEQAPDYSQNIKQSFNSLRQAVGGSGVNDFNKPMGSDDISQMPPSHPESVAYPDDMQRHQLVNQKLGITPESMAMFKAKMDAQKQQDAEDKANMPPDDLGEKAFADVNAKDKDAVPEDPADAELRKQALARVIKARTSGY